MAGTGASHAAEIAAGDVKELEAARVEQKDALVNLTKGRPGPGLQDWWDQFQGYVASKQRELAIEFRHNVQIDPTNAATSLNSYAEALEGMPLDATWTSAQLITIRRGGSRGTIGGDTDASTGEITMYDAGMTPAPYKPKCAELTGLQTNMQAIRHEIGHLVDARLTAKERAGLFEDVLDWRMHLIQNITKAGNERVRRAKLKDAPRLDADEAHLDKVLAELMGELGTTDAAETLAFVGSFGDPSAEDPAKPPPARVFKDRNGRLYWRHR